MSVFNAELEKKKEFAEQFTEYTKLLQERTPEKRLIEYSQLRAIELEAVKEAGIFYIENPAEILVPKYIGLVEDFGVIGPSTHRPIFSNRYIMPFYDTDGTVLNLVGYRKDSDTRYIYGNAKYYIRKDTLYGLENLELAYDLGYAFLTEGITDCQRLRSMGFKNTFAMCGTHSSDYIISQLSRCRHGVIKIPDRDKPGWKALKGWQYKRSITVHVPMKYKDSDEMLNLNNDNAEQIRALFRQYMATCIKVLTSGTLPLDKTVTII